MAGFFDSVLRLFRKKEEPNSQQQKKQETAAINIPAPHNSVAYRPVEAGSSTLNGSESAHMDIDDLSMTVYGHPVYIPPVISSPKSGIKWAGPGETITVQGFTIHNPLTYWATIEYPEASCIVTGLKVIIHSQGVLPSLPYWPQYSAITPAQKGKYLSWLSRGRNDDLDEIGYAFIFFYGLERRAIIEKTDHGIILDEVRRLLARYPLSGSFNSYLNQFMAYIAGSHLSDMKEVDIKKLFPEFDNLNYDTVNVILSWHWMNNLSVPWDVCYSLMVTSRNIQRTNIPRKAPTLLKQLFRKKFQDQFPTGIPFLSKYEQFQLNYRPASASLLHYVGYTGRAGLIEPLILPIPNLNSSPFDTVKKIWLECIDEIKPVSNKLAKTEGKMTREVYGLLPELLKKEIPHPDLETWRNFISTRPSADGSVIVNISDLAQMAGIEKRSSLTSAQSRTITSLVKDFGWIIVPDQTVSGTAFKWNDNVAIIPLNDTDKNVSEKFQSAALIFEMAYGTAASDENVTESEMNYLSKFVSEQFSLNALEVECLKGLGKVLEIQPLSLSRIGKRLSKYLNSEQKSGLANFLGEMVLLDDRFTKQEHKALKTVFKSLEIDPTISEELIKKLLIGHTPDEPITVQKAGSARKGEPIPPQEIKPEFSIDREKLKRTREDTKAVQSILATVFEQEEQEVIIEIEQEVKIPKGSVIPVTRQTGIDLPFPPETVPSLDTKYLSILHDIMKSNELSQDDFTGLARKYNLMPRAAFDDINAWADEELGDFLLEENENRIVINYKK